MSDCVKSFPTKIFGGLKLLRVTHEIWETVAKNAQEKAKYLRKLFLEHAKDFEPTFYLDIGAGLGYNTLIFGQDATEILATDLQLRKNSILKESGKAHFIVADAEFLPLKENMFDMVSLFSVIEHVKDQMLVLKEAARVLKSEGKLTIQIPNRFFPLDLHSGLPFVFLIPPRISRPVLEKMGYEWLARISIPSKKKLVNMISRTMPKAKIIVKNVIYPPSLVLPRLQQLYRFLGKIGILDSIPLGYFFIVEK